jgi:hypothetical protein
LNNGLTWRLSTVIEKKLSSCFSFARAKPELLEKVSKNAYSWVRENFDREKTVKAWQEIMAEFEISQ